jgi:hypothetical protein
MIFNARGVAARLAWSWLRMNLLSRPSAGHYDLSAQGG